MPKKKETGKKGLGLQQETQQHKEVQQGRSWFFGIGINHYQEFSNLNNAVKDVENIRDLLINKYDLESDNVTILIDEAATRENIIDQLDRLIGQVKEQDKLIIYYSGHGHLDRMTTRGYWIPHDAKKGKTANYIRNSTIRDYVKDIKSLHTLLISDSCFSGTLFVRGMRRSSYALDELETIPSRWAICSGRHNEEVFDGIPGQNSPFAECILDVLNHNQKKVINVAKLADRIVEQTRANYTQLPEGKPLFGVGDKGGQYVFRLKANEAEDWSTCQADGSLAAFRIFLENYPNGRFANEAQRKLNILEEEAAWEKARAMNTILAYYNYKKKYSQGRYSQHALDAIAELEEEEAWQEANTKNKLSAYSRYTAEYPQGKYKTEAEDRIQSIISKKGKGRQRPPIAADTQLQADRNARNPLEVFVKKHARWAIPLVILPIVIWLIISIVANGSTEGELTSITSTQLRNQVEALGIDVKNLKLQLDEKQVTVYGEADSQSDKEQILSFLGGLSEISEIQDSLTLAHTHPLTNDSLNGEAEVAIPGTPEINHQFLGNELTITISKGVAPYRLRLTKDGLEKYGQDLSKAGSRTIALTEYRKDPGRYVIDVEDNAGRSTSKRIMIDPPKPKISYGKVTLDEQSYRTIRLNGNTWLADNLNYEVPDSWCYNGEKANCSKYGRLYSWEAAKKACKYLGPGWHLPTAQEWQNMLKDFGGAKFEDAKDDGQAAYQALIKGGKSGFSAQFGGSRNSAYPEGFDLGEYGYYWSDFEISENYAREYSFSRVHGTLVRHFSYKTWGRSCRCIKSVTSNDKS